MTALEMIKTLRICNSHPSMEGLGCRDCPYDEKCGIDENGGRVGLEAADIIEELMKELAKARAGAE